MKDDIRRYVRLKTAPEPLPAFSGKHRHEDGLQIYADRYSLIIWYEAKLPRIARWFSTEVMVQFTGFQKYEHSSLGREVLAKPKHEPLLEVTQGPKMIIFAAEFQGSRLHVEAEGYRAYAIHEGESLIKERPLIGPEALIAKRAYWEHQLRDVHFKLFDKVSRENKERVWKRIQERYLFRYSRFLRVEADWGSSGIWGISFPGSYGTTPNYGYENFNLPKLVVRRFKEWTRLYDSLNPADLNMLDALDLPAFNREGEWLARELKKVVDEDTYVEYHPGREIQ